ncbi:MAG: FAD-binding protein [Thermodesulfobacteriota bacterium]|nr:FAD-binding protein [Thermodesulfobacteriota bacterium]
MISHDILIVGSGLTGLRAAIEAFDGGADVAVVTKLFPIRSHSTQAQGGINASLANHPEGRDDNWEKHAFDTIKGSDFLADQDAVEVFAMEAPMDVYQLENWGCPFSRFPDGKIAQRPFGGAGFPRTCFGADKTGLYLMNTLYEQTIRRNVKFYEEWVALALIVEDQVCRGIVAYNLPKGVLEVFKAKAVIFSTGGNLRIYPKTSNSLSSTASGLTIALNAGLPLKDMEFVQFHPTTLVGLNLTLTEGARGEGAYLLNGLGERFMSRYVSEAIMERAPRDITSRSIQTEIDEGRGIGGGDYVYLDMRHLGADNIRERFPTVYELCTQFRGVDPTREQIPIQPSAHYSMGGIDCDLNCRTEVEGFFAAGECACVGIHGANRLGGNSLMETVVFGRHAGASAVQYLKDISRKSTGNGVYKDALLKQEKRLKIIFEKTSTENQYQIKSQLGSIMQEKAGIFRHEEGLKEALSELKTLQKRFRKVKAPSKGQNFNYDLMWHLDIEGFLTISEAILMGALAREESRGSHARRDYRERDDRHWLKHTVARLTKGKIALSYKPVTITKFGVEKRVY